MRRLFFGLTHWIEEVKISYLASGFFTACLIVKPIPAVHAPPTITTKGITWKIDMKINLSYHLKEQNKEQRKNTEINMSDKLFSVTLFLQNESLERESSNGWWVPLFAGKDESGYYAPCQFASKLMFSLLKNSVCAILHGKNFKVTTFTSRKNGLFPWCLYSKEIVFSILLTVLACITNYVRFVASWSCLFKIGEICFFFQEPFIALVLLLMAVCQKTAGSTIVISYFLAHWQLQCSWASSKMYKNNCCVYIPRKS